MLQPETVGSGSWAGEGGEILVRPVCQARCIGPPRQASQGAEKT